MYDHSISPQEKKNKVKAAIATTIITLLVFLMLLFITMKLDELLLGEDGGVEVQMGNPNEGGDDQTPQNQRVVPVQPQRQESIQEELATNQTDGVNINQTEKPKPKPNPTNPTPTENKPTEPEKKINDDLQRMMDNAKNSKGSGGNSSGNKGEEDGKGNNPDGGDGANGKTGSGQSMGNFKIDGFSNRGFSQIPSDKSKCVNAKGGIVVLDIEVDAAGRVIDAKAGARGTTTFEQCLYDEAVELAKKVRLDARPGSPNARGRLTITFRN
jgi:hypothetical protein